MAAGAGGGLHHAAEAQIDASTFASNSAATGGAIYNDGAQLLAQNSTIVGNSGEPAIHNDLNASTTLSYVTLIAQTAAVGGEPSEVSLEGTSIRGGCDEGLEYSSLGGNAESPGTSCFEEGDTDITGLTTLGLFVLGDYGGSTPTAPPKLTSPLIDLAEECSLTGRPARSLAPGNAGRVAKAHAIREPQRSSRQGIESSLVSVDSFELENPRRLGPHRRLTPTCAFVLSTSPGGEKFVRWQSARVRQTLPTVRIRITYESPIDIRFSDS